MNNEINIQRYNKILIMKLVLLFKSFIKLLHYN